MHAQQLTAPAMASGPDTPGHDDAFDAGTDPERRALLCAIIVLTAAVVGLSLVVWAVATTWSTLVAAPTAGALPVGVLLA